LSIGPERPVTFDTFMTGASTANAAALAHVRATAVLSGTPLFLWGASGSGKTHLLRSLADAVTGAGGRVGWFDNGIAAPWVFCEDWSLVVFDGCDAFDSEQQQAAFSLFVGATSQGMQVAASGCLPPVDLPLRDDLRTRLGWGHVFALEPLGESDARAALRREADRRGIFLSDEVMGYLLTRFSRDLKHLMGLLDRLDEFSLAEHRAVTVPLLKKMFEQEGATL
jgi:DnaA family protein